MYLFFGHIMAEMDGRISTGFWWYKHIETRQELAEDCMEPIRGSSGSYEIGCLHQSLSTSNHRENREYSSKPGLFLKIQIYY